MVDSKPFARHFWPFFAMVMAPANGWIVTGGGDGSLRRWDLLERREMGTPIAADSRWVLAVAITPDGRQIVSGGGDGVVRLWDVDTGKLIREASSHVGLIWTLAVSSDGTRVISGGDDGTLCEWDLRTGNAITIIRTEQSVRAVAVSPDGAELVLSGTDSVIRRTGDRPDLAGHEGWVQALALTPDGTALVSGGSDGTIRRWDLRTGRAIGDPLLGHDGTVFTVAVTPDGKRIVSGGSDGSVRTWDFADGTAIGALSGHTDWVRSVQVSAGGERVVSCSNDGTIGVLSLPGGISTGEFFEGPAVAVNALAVHHGTDTVFSASIDGSVRRWDGRTGRALGRLRSPDGWVNALAVSPDGELLVRVGEDGQIVRWSAVAGDPAGQSITGHEGGVRAIAFTPDGRRIVSAGADGTVRRWDRDSGDQIGPPLKRHRGVINSVVVTPDGKQIVAACSDDGRLIRWDADTGSRLGEPISAHPRAALTVSVDGAGRRLVSGGDDGRVCVWDADTGEHDLTSEGRHKGSVTVVRFSPDGRRIYSGGTDRLVRQWDAETGASAGEPLRGHDGTITSLAFLDDAGTVLLSGSADGTVRKWDLSSGAQLPAETEPAVVVETLPDVQSDLESSVDRLDIAEDVRRVGAMLAAVAVQPPLSVALLGDWGTGKSTFMCQLRAWLEDTASKARARPGSAYVSNVKQVTFNAWHYSDDHLWVGLVEHMFRELAKDEPAPTPDKAAELEATANEVAQLKAKLSTRKADRERLAADLGAIDRIGADRGWFAALRAPLRSARVARAALRSTWRELRSPRGWLVALIAVAGIGGVLLGVRFGQSQLTWIGAAIAGAAGVLTPVVTAWRRLAESTENVRKQLLRRKQELDTAIEKADDALARVDPAHRLHRLLAEISTAERYADFRGLTGRIHHDLRRLSDDLAKTRGKWLEGGETGRPPLQRVVLYVDDLDRCRPGRVVDVLQAVNLLLTMDLFMVVVAVDPRWLLNALNEHHGGLLADRVRPLDYLDKIFHIPFALRPMGLRAAGYLRSMLPVMDEAEPKPLPENEISPASTSDVVEVPDRAAPAFVRHDTVEATPELPLPNIAPPAVDLAGDGLRIRSFEQDFLAEVAVLLPTPRAVKKLANLYRLVRLSVPEERLENFLDDAEYQAAALLLATLVGDPHRARSLLVRLSTSSSVRDIAEELEDDQKSYRLYGWVETLRRMGIKVHGEMTTYQAWAGTVARYGFETYDLFAERD